MAECACGEPSTSPLRDAEIERRSEQLKALSNPTRLRMVDLIYHGGGEICVCEFMDHFDLSQPTISHHLKALRDAGLIKSRKDGTFVYHRIDETAFSGLATLMSRLRTPNEASELVPSNAEA